MGAAAPQRQQQQQAGRRRRPLVTRTAAAAAALFLLGATMEGCAAFLLPAKTSSTRWQQRLHAAAGEGASTSTTTTTPIDITAPSTPTTAAAAAAPAAVVATPYTPGVMGGVPSSSALSTSLDPIGRIDANPQALLDWVKQGRCVSDGFCCGSERRGFDDDVDGRYQFGEINITSPSHGPSTPTPTLRTIRGVVHEAVGLTNLIGEEGLPSGASDSDLARWALHATGDVKAGTVRAFEWLID